MFSSKKLFNSTILGLTFGVLIAGYAVFAFQAPTQAPPLGNTPLPINTGSVDQIKTGGMLTVFNQWINGALGVTGGATFGGNVGIGTITPGQKLSVNGSIESLTGGFKFPDGTVQATKSCQSTASLPPRNPDTVYQNTRSGAKIVIISIQVAGLTDFSSWADISADGVNWTRIAQNAGRQAVYSQSVYGGGGPQFQLIFTVPPSFFYRVSPSDASARSAGALWVNRIWQEIDLC